MKIGQNALALLVVVLVLAGLLLPGWIGTPIFILALLIGALTLFAPPLMQGLLRWLRPSPHSMTYARYACGIAVIALIVSAIAGRPILHKQELALATGAFLVAVCAFAFIQAVYWICGLDSSRDAGAWQAAPLPDLRGMRWWAFGIGCVLLFVVAEISGDLIGKRLYPEIGWRVSHHLQFVMLCTGAGLVIYGLAGKLKIDSRPTDGVNAAPTSVGMRYGASVISVQWNALRDYLAARRWTVLAVVGISVLALILRLWNAGETVRMLIDEMHFTVGDREFWIRPDVKLLTPMSGLSPFTWLYPYWQTWLLDVFGRDLGVFRWISGVIGTLNILGLMLLARTLFDRPTALLAGLLLAVFPPHLHFSRMGIIQIADPLFGTFGLAFLARGLVHGRRADFAAGGVMIGLAQYFYEGGRLLFPPLAALWLGGALLIQHFRVSTDRPSGKIAARNYLIFLLALGVITFTLYYVLVVTGYTVTGRLNASGLNREYWQNLLQTLQSGGQLLPQHLDRLTGPFRVYTATADLISTTYGGLEPLIVTHLVPLFLIGVCWLLARAWQPGMLLLVVWIGATSAGNVLLVDGTVPARYVVVFPALALTLAVALRYTFDLLRWLFDGVLNRQFSGADKGLKLVLQTSKTTRDRIAAVAVILVIGAITIGQVLYYFIPHLEVYQSQIRWRTDERDGQDAALRARDFPINTTVVFITDQEFNYPFTSDLLNFIRPDLSMEAWQIAEVTEGRLQALNPGRSWAFFVEMGDATTPTLLRRTLAVDGPYFTPNSAIPPRQQFVLYLLAAQP